MDDVEVPVGAHSSDPALGALLSQLFARSDWLGEPIELSWADDQHSSSDPRLVDWGVGKFGQPPTELPTALVLIVQRQLRLALADDPSRLHLHGALVGCPEAAGARVLMLGASGAGKSTMAAQLVHLGVAYATDEMVAVDGECLTEAVRKPLKLRQAARERYKYLESLVDPLMQGGGGDVPITPDARQLLDDNQARLTDVVVLNRHEAEPNCAQTCPTLEPVTTVTMTRRMAENAFDFSRFGVGASLLRLARLAASTRCWELRYCDSQQAAPLLARLTEPEEAPPPTAEGPDARPTVSTDSQAPVGLRVGGPGLVCRPDLPEHLIVELNKEAFDVWELGRLGIESSEIASTLGLPPTTVQACLTMLNEAALL